jgi:hypothetical protein
MERVRDLSWGSPFASIAVEARTGFEPVFPEKEAAERQGDEAERRDVCELPADLQRIVERLTRAARAGADEPAG